MDFLHYFYKISEIPRGSGQEEAISSYLMRFAEENGLSARRDDSMNVVIEKPAFSGYENVPPVILQAHMDMVCEKETGSPHDFLKDPLDVYEDKGYLRARGTTLGADNGIGLSYILAVLSDQCLPHPAIEAVFTTGEETGLRGMAALDSSCLKGKRFINLDGEKEGVLLCSCAGGQRLQIELDASFSPVSNTEPFSISVRGLRGGHSGLAIKKGGANAISLLARVLNELNSKFFIQVADFWGGAKDNTIPREACAMLWLKKEEAEKAIDKICGLSAVIQDEYGVNDPGISIDMKKCSGNKKSAFDKNFLEKLLSAILLGPSGVIYKSPYFNDEVDTSGNLGILEMKEGRVVISIMIRSNTNSRMGEIFSRISLLAKMLNGRIVSVNAYPAWTFNPNSDLRTLCCDVYQKLFGKKPCIATVHGGLECAFMADQRPDMDMVSFGPNIKDVHTFREKVEIKSVAKNWDFLLGILKEMH